MPGLPAVRNLRQDFAEFFNVLFSPSMNAHAAKLNGLGLWDFLSSNVAAQCHRINPKSSGDLTSGKHFHSVIYVADIFSERQVKNETVDDWRS